MRPPWRVTIGGGRREGRRAFCGSLGYGGLSSAGCATARGCAVPVAACRGVRDPSRVTARKCAFISLRMLPCAIIRQRAPLRAFIHLYMQRELPRTFIRLHMQRG